MRTNIVLDDKLVKEAFKCTGAKTKKELVDQALRELVRQNKRADIRELRGKGMLDPTYDYKAARRGR